MGSLALRVWLSVLVVVGMLAVVAVMRPTIIVTLGSNDTVLMVAKIGLAVLGVAWLYLVLDAWRLARPASLSRRGRLVLTTGTGLAFLVVAGLISSSMHLLDVQRDLVGSVFAKGPSLGTVDGRYNVLIVGGDAGSDREGLRPDSLTVASVDAETGQAVLVGIPRNLMDAPFPDGTRLAELWPNGYDCGDECIINSLYTWANDNAEELPPSDDPGLEATRLAAEGVTGLEIPYTAVVDMQGFEQVVDALGGVTVDIGKRVPIGGGTGPIEGYIEPGVQQLDGYEALWFARSREGSSDYERMVRQKCLTSSLARQADPMTVLRNYERLARASSALVQTDIPRSDLPGLLTVAQKVPSQQINAISLVPPLVEPADPRFSEIHTMVGRMVAGEPAIEPAAEGAGDGGGDGTVGNAGSTASSATQGSVGAPSSGSEGEQAESSEGASASTSEETGLTAAELGLVCQAV